MDNNELLTVKQFAEAVGVSQQAVYQAMQGKLKPYLILEQGKKYISKQAIIDLYSSTESPEQTQELKGLVKGKQGELENLLKEVEKLEQALNKELEKNVVLNQQIEEKNKEISRLEHMQENLNKDKENLYNQLVVKDKQIENLNMLLSQQQALHLKQLEDKHPEPEPEHLQEELTAKDNMLTEQAEQIEKLKAELIEEKNKGFFKRLFKR